MLSTALKVPYANRLLAGHTISPTTAPLLTIAIPHYKHRQYLEQVLCTVFDQSFTDFEIVVSDDSSPDDSRQVIPDLLTRSGRSFRYYAQPQNLGYDGNVRYCLASALGRYVLLLGNDDALASPSVVSDVARALHELEMPAVAFTNFADWRSGATTRRAQATRGLGRGPETALGYFRSFSFVSGILFDRAQALAHETDRWDRSIYYQIYLASRIIAAGGMLGAIDVCAVRKDIVLGEQTVPNYATKWTKAPRSFASRHTGLDSVIRVTADAVLPYVPQRSRSGVLRRIISQIFTITYPFWLFEYRRIANWSFAVGIARGLSPHGLLAEYALKASDRLFLWLLYLAVTLAGLTVPAGLFNRFRSQLADLIRRRQQRVGKKTS